MKIDKKNMMENQTRKTLTCNLMDPSFGLKKDMDDKI